MNVEYGRICLTWHYFNDNYCPLMIHVKRTFVFRFNLALYLTFDDDDKHMVVFNVSNQSDCSSFWMAYWYINVIRYGVFITPIETFVTNI